MVKIVDPLIHTFSLAYSKDLSPNKPRKQKKTKI